MCEVLTYYDRWVNGADLRIADLIAGRLPSHAPAPSPGEVLHANRTVLQLEPYGESSPPLPQLDASKLATVRHVLVHGSMATRDACGFSDIDIAVIVDDLHSYTPDQHRRAVRELRRLLRAALGFDSLMHHGLMFFPASKLERYDERFLPIEALRCARVLHGPATVHLHAAPAPLEEFRASLRAAAASLRKRFSTSDFLQNDYQLKNVLAGILLMPARVLAARGVMVYKRDSFELARELFTPAQWDLIGRSEALRSTWVRPAPPALNRCVPPGSHPHLRRVFGSHMAPRLNARRISPRMLEGLRAGANAFLDRVEAIG